MSSPSTSRFSLPSPLLKFYSNFPLVILPNEDSPDSAPERATLWIYPSRNKKEKGQYQWASSDPTCLRYQLLFLLRGVDVEFRPWDNVEVVPEAILPALHLPTGQLLPHSEIRAWLDKEFPLEESVKALNGLPTQEAHTTALAYSHLVLQKIYPAYMSATTPIPTQIHLPFPLNSPGCPSPLTLPPKLYSSLPYFLRNLTGGLDKVRWEGERARKGGVEGVRGVGEWIREGKVGEKGWFLGASSPSPLDALLVSHLHPLSTLPSTDPLRIAYEKEGDDLMEYVERVMNEAESMIR